MQAAILPVQLAYSTYKDSQIHEELRFDGYEIGSKEDLRGEKKSTAESLSKLSRPDQASVTAKLSYGDPQNYATLFASHHNLKINIKVTLIANPPSM